MGTKRSENVRRAGIEVPLTNEQLLELNRCRKDPVYFIEKYVVIKHPKRGEIPFKLYPYQRNLIRAYQNSRWNIVLSARQTGKSTTSAAYILWFGIFHFNKDILIASNKNKNAMEMVYRIRFAYERLPEWIKPGVLDDGWNKHSVAFDNGSRIDSSATSETAGRTMSIALLYLDEFAFVQPNIQEQFWSAMEPTLATGGDCIITSTPNGDVNLFAQLWRGAQVGANGFHPSQVTWDEPPGRDQKYKEETIGRIGEHKWLQEYECKFLSSDPLLIKSMILNNLEGFIVHPLFEKNGIKFWDTPKKGGVYLVGVDPATGTGKDFSVFEVYEFPAMKQIAEFRSNSMSSPLVYTILKWLLSSLEQIGAMAYFSVENNGVGEGVISLYEADETPPMTCEMISDEGKKRRGMVTTRRVKMKACNNLRQVIERGKIHIQSKLVLNELKTFVLRGNSYEAQPGSTDDTISAHLIIMRLLQDIATYEQDAHDALYNVDENEYLEEDWGDNELEEDDPELPISIG